MIALPQKSPFLMLSMRSQQGRTSRSFFFLIGILSLFFSAVHGFSFNSINQRNRHDVARPIAHQGPRLSIALHLSSNDESNTKDYFIREAIFAGKCAMAHVFSSFSPSLLFFSLGFHSPQKSDMGTASRILADGFFGDRDFITYQIEKLRTYLSLESDFPKARDQHVMLVACQNTNGKVVAVCDVDNRPNLKTERPYMCNLAVGKQWRGKGLAKALISQCEEIVKEWGETDLHLKARQRNGAAIALYKSLGYAIESELYDVSYRDHLVVMKKSVGAEEMNGTSAVSKEEAEAASAELLSDTVERT
jgi:ribosomal protein S18 acetylase RimI-like enzyme